MALAYNNNALLNESALLYTPSLVGREGEGLFLVLYSSLSGSQTSDRNAERFDMTD